MSATNLTERAMLVTLSIGGFPTSRKQNRATTEQILAKELLGKESGAWIDNLWPPNAFDELRGIESEAREMHDEIASPWGDDGSRILSSARFMEHRAAMTMMRARFEAAVREFADKRDEHVAWAQANLNGHFNAANYPAKEAMQARFYYRTHYAPIANAADFRVNLTETDMEAVRASIESDVRERTEAAMRAAWERASEPLQKLAANLRGQAEYTNASGKRIKPKDMTAYNLGVLTDLVELLPDLNFAGDAKFDAAVRDIKNHLTAKADTLVDKDKDAARKAAAAKAEEILKRMSGYMK